MDIAGALTSISLALGIVKDLRSLDQSFATAELKLKMADLMTALADAKMAMVDVQAQLADKDQQIQALISASAFNKALVEYNGYKYEKGPDGTPVGAPFCPVCEAEAGLYIRTAIAQAPGMPPRCPRCKADYLHRSVFLYPNEM